MKNGVYEVPKEIDTQVARIKLRGIGISIDELTDRQREYLTSWKEGTV
jgi:adenosylhomocysteinase